MTTTTLYRYLVVYLSFSKTTKQHDFAKRKTYVVEDMSELMKNIWNYLEENKHFMLHSLVYVETMDYSELNKKRKKIIQNLIKKITK